MRTKGRTFARRTDVERAFEAAWATLQIVAKLKSAGCYLLDMKPSDTGAIQQPYGELRALRRNNHYLRVELSKREVTDVFNRAAVRLRMPVAAACGLKDVSAHRLVLMVGVMADVCFVRSGGSRGPLGELTKQAERELLAAVQRAVPKWREMEPLDSEELSVRLQRGSLEAEEWIEDRLEEEAAAAKLATAKLPLERVAGGQPAGKRESLRPEKQSIVNSLTPLDNALALLVQNPELSDTEIAEAVGVHRSTLYKPNWKPFHKAREALKSGRDAILRGEKDGKSGTVEAWDTDE